MNRKLILLIMCLPLILMLSLFSVSKTVVLAINIAVSKIQIFGDKIVYIDLDDAGNYLVNYTIYPTNAKNKQVHFSTEAIAGVELAELEYENNCIQAKSCGAARVYLTTADGGFRDSIVVYVESNRLQSISSNVDTDSIYVGDTTQIYTAFNPASNTTLLNYEVNDAGKSVVSVSPNGLITGLSKGTAEITISSTKYPQVKDVVTVEVKNRDIIDFQKTEVTTWQKQGNVKVSLDTEEECEFSFKAYDENDCELDDSLIVVSLNKTDMANGIISLDYELIDKTFTGSITLELVAETEGGLIVTKKCKIEYINEITAQFVEAEQICSVRVGLETLEMFEVNPSDADVKIECELSNDNIDVSVNDANKFIVVSGKKLGVTTISLKVFNNENLDEFVQISKEVVITSNTLSVAESTNIYGIENVLAMGKTEADGSQSHLKLNLAYGKVKQGASYVDVVAGEGFSQNLYWKSTNVNATIDRDGTISLVGTSTTPEIVSFNAYFEYKGVRFESSSFAIKCVYDGVNVRNYKDLHRSTNAINPQPIVLHSDIKEDFAVGVSNYYKEITTTYDKTYYKNTGSLEKAKIKVLIEFKNDVYGNGYTINAHNVAWNQNLPNQGSNAVFNGPLNFVAMSENGGMISVKAQDNVCFAVYEGVTISNIQLKGCDLQPDANNQYDLSDLTYTGTTVEVFGDNVNIKHSRISNGRTVLRAFGDINDQTKNIHLNISNSVLSSAREFIIRLGTNCFIEGTKEDCSPTLPNDNNKTFPAQKRYDAMTKEEKAEYDQMFVKTFVTIKNSVLKDAGIFAIGLDTHFAGAALEDGSKYLGGLIKDWYDLAKTSYGVKLTFEGDIRLYNWKNLQDIDSSTLIETFGPTTFTDISFDVKQMVDTMSQNSNFTNIIYQDTKTGAKYVHGGIAFFGGGKNYSVFDGSNSVTYDLNGYEIKLSDVGKVQLQAAAGNESFYFLMSDATTQNFLPTHQEEILKSEDAYSCIFKN